jgi:hypothetical protein
MEKLLKNCFELSNVKYTRAKLYFIHGYIKNKNYFFFRYHHHHREREREREPSKADHSNDAADLFIIHFFLIFFFISTSAFTGFHFQSQENGYGSVSILNIQ